MKQGFEISLGSDKDLVSKDNLTDRVFKIGIKAPASTVKKDRPALNISIIIDRSGSMSGGKLDYAKMAAQHVVKLLNEQDHVSVVCFDDSVTVVAPSVQATSANKHFVTESIAGIREGGSTNLSGGWLKGCQLIAETQQAEQLCRAILLTDGEANSGIVDPSELAKHAQEISGRGISTTTFGIGLGFNEHLLEAIATNGRGNFHYIASPEQIPQLFERELGELGEIMIKNINVELMVPFGYNFRVLGSYINLPLGNKVTIKVNDLFSEAVEEVYVIATIHNQPDIASIGCVVTLTGLDTENQPVSIQAEHILTYAGQADVDAAPALPELVARYAEVTLSDLQTEGLRMERRGEGPMAAEKIMAALMKFRSFLAADRVYYYTHVADRMRSNNMAEMEHKEMHTISYNTKKNRQW